MKKTLDTFFFNKSIKLRVHILISIDNEHLYNRKTIEHKTRNSALTFAWTQPESAKKTFENIVKSYKFGKPC